jgi:hypothetical protein
MFLLVWPPLDLLEELTMNYFFFIDGGNDQTINNELF